MAKEFLKTHDTIFASRVPTVVVSSSTMAKEFFEMLVAGAESTSMTLGWLMSLLIKNPRVTKKMQEQIVSVEGRERMVNEDNVANMENLHCVVMETLRLYPSLPLLRPHESTEDCRVKGYFIPADRQRLGPWKGPIGVGESS